MKTVVMVATAIVVSAASAGATDITGKWGIGAGLFNGGGEASLIRGHSERTAYVFTLSFGGRASDSHFESPAANTVPDANSNDWRVRAGPRLRRFTRPSSDFSPYGDVFLDLDYARRHDSSGPRNQSILGVSSGLGFGVEYFTRWRCSVAVNTDLVRLGWTSVARPESPA